MPKLVDLTKNIFGNLIVLYRGENSSAGSAKWACKCSCGEVVLVYGGSLTSGATKSCGCMSDRGKRYSVKPASKYVKYSNKRKRNRLYGIGINDGQEDIASIKNKGTDSYAIYSIWTRMMRRGYSVSFKKSHPTYKNCTVAEEWHRFSNFKSWVETQDWRGKELDKDILIKGNKLYSPSTCLFVSHHVNSLLHDNAASRGKYPQGITFDGKNKKYRAKVSLNCSSIHIGRYASINKAISAYEKAKAKIIYDEALNQVDVKIYSALMFRAYEFIR